VSYDKPIKQNKNEWVGSVCGQSGSLCCVQNKFWPCANYNRISSGLMQITIVFLN
jgi:hypothetical protein